MQGTRILIIEDEKQIARFLELELQHEGYIVEIKHDGQEGLRAVEQNMPHLVILDLMLPGLNGMEVCRRIRQFSEVPIIMLTARSEIMDKVMGLDIGANDYITKPFAIEELFARIRMVMRKKDSEEPLKNILELGDLVLDLSDHSVVRGKESIALTKREYDLLEYLIKNKGIVLSRDQILENVWGFDYVGETNSVDVYIRYLRNKVDEKHKKKLIHTVRGVGYLVKE